MNIDNNIIEKLLSFCDLNAFGPGALLYNPNKDGKNIQLNFLKNVISDVSPEIVLETGTESGMFSYFVKCIIPKVKVVTFGMSWKDNRSFNCTKYLNDTLGNYITYIEGDSKITLTNFNMDNIKFAWIDGGHDYNTLYKDLENCNRLNIPNICIDDYNGMPEIRRAIADFTKNNNYVIISTTNDDRGICYVKLKD